MDGNCGYPTNKYSATIRKMERKTVTENAKRALVFCYKCFDKIKSQSCWFQATKETPILLHPTMSLTPSSILSLSLCVIVHIFCLLRRSNVIESAVECDRICDRMRSNRGEELIDFQGSGSITELAIVREGPCWKRVSPCRKAMSTLQCFAGQGPGIARDAMIRGFEAEEGHIKTSSPHGPSRTPLGPNFSRVCSKSRKRAHNNLAHFLRWRKNGKKILCISTVINRSIVSPIALKIPIEENPRISNFNRNLDNSQYFRSDCFSYCSAIEPLQSLLEDSRKRMLPEKLLTFIQHWNSRIVRKMMMNFGIASSNSYWCPGKHILISSKENRFLYSFAITGRFHLHIICWYDAFCRYRPHKPGSVPTCRVYISHSPWTDTSCKFFSFSWRPRLAPWTTSAESNSEIRDLSVNLRNFERSFLEHCPGKHSHTLVHEYSMRPWPFTETNLRFSRNPFRPRCADSFKHSIFVPSESLKINVFSRYQSSEEPFFEPLFRGRAVAKKRDGAKTKYPGHRSSERNIALIIGVNEAEKCLCTRILPDAFRKSNLHCTRVGCLHTLISRKLRLQVELSLKRIVCFSEGNPLPGLEKSPLRFLGKARRTVRHLAHFNPILGKLRGNCKGKQKDEARLLMDGGAHAPLLLPGAAPDHIVKNIVDLTVEYEFWSFDHRYSTERNLFLIWRIEAVSPRYFRWDREPGDSPYLSFGFRTGSLGNARGSALAHKGGVKPMCIWMQPKEPVQNLMSGMRSLLVPEPAKYAKLPVYEIIHIFCKKPYVRFINIFRAYSTLKITSSFLFTGNPLECDCRLDWLHGLYNNTNSEQVRQSIEEMVCIQSTRDLEIEPLRVRRPADDGVFNNFIPTAEPSEPFIEKNFLSIPREILPCPQELRATGVPAVQLATKPLSSAQMNSSPKPSSHVRVLHARSPRCQRKMKLLINGGKSTAIPQYIDPVLI
ncbi:unnamed protein product, partial [Nesidiocoris tenuis]